MAAPGRLERLSGALATLRRVVLDSPAETPVDVRRAAFAGSAADGTMAAYVELVDRHAYRVTEATVSGLRASGLSDDGIFELTVAAALGAAQRRFDAGTALVGTRAET
jgi:alkylhydroperoxidase family enzyme